ncbi:uncharacterized protein METZ01_LOCUS11947 [marine metagenome]|uniref:Aminotransferase class V domain-containing protein n=1 Tax=marine metagenome TaxID=408172 RepID=A0A381P075_9ZZZZ
MLNIAPEPIPSSSIELGNRSLFDQITAKSYLNYAAFTPPSNLIKTTMDHWFETYSSLGAGAYMLWANQRDRLREKLALLLGCNKDDIGLGGSTSSLISDISLMIDWKKNDRILVFNGDFPSVITPFKSTASIFDLEIVMHELDSFYHSPEEGLANIEKELKKGLRLIAVSSTQFQTGLLMPIKEISLLCKKYGAEILVDAAQSAGAIDFNVEEQQINYLMAPTHKWLMGSEGSAILYVSPESMSKLVLRRTGWMSFKDGEQFLFGKPNLLRYDLEARQKPSIVEMGMTNSLGFASLEAGITCHLHLGMDRIATHIQSLHDHLEEGLTNLGFKSFRTKYKEGRSSLLGMLPPDGYETPTIFAEMIANKISISQPDGYLRFAPSWPTNNSEITHIIDVAKSFLSK